MAKPTSASGHISCVSPIPAGGTALIYVSDDTTHAGQQITLTLSDGVNTAEVTVNLDAQGNGSTSWTDTGFSSPVLISGGGNSACVLTLF